MLNCTSGPIPVNAFIDKSNINCLKHGLSPLKKNINAKKKPQQPAVELGRKNEDLSSFSNCSHCQLQEKKIPYVLHILSFLIASKCLKEIVDHM